MAQRIEFEGKIHEFPDDFTQDDIANALSGGSVDPTLPTPPTGNEQIDTPNAFERATGRDMGTFPLGDFVSDLLRQGKLAVQSAGRAGANLLGIPGDLSVGTANAVASLAEGVGPAIETAWNTVVPDKYDADLPDYKLPRFGPSIVGSDAIADITGKGQIVNALGLAPIPKEQMSKEERAVGDIATFMTESLLGGAGLARAAGRETIEETAKRAPKMSDALLNPYRVNRKQALVTDALAGGGAGAGNYIANEVVPEQAQGPITTLMSMLLGGYGGAAIGSGGRVVKHTAQSIKDRVLPERIPYGEGLKPTSRIVARRAAEIMQGASGAPGSAKVGASDPKRAAEQIGERTAEARREGEPVPTVGIQTDDVGLNALEKGMRLNDPVRFQESDEALRKAAQDKVTGLKDPDADQMAPRRLVEQETQAQRDTAQEGVDRAQAGLEQATEAEKALGGQVAARRGSEVAASEDLAKAVLSTKEVDEAYKAGLYREAEDLGRSVNVDPTPLIENAKAVRADISPLASTEPKLNNILTDLERLAPETGTPEPITLRDLIAMRPRLSMARDAASKAAQGDVVQRIDQINKGIAGEIGKLADAGDAAALKWRKAEQNFRDKFALKYREGVGGQMDRAERSGQPVPPTAVAPKFIRPGAGGKEAAEDLKRILAGSEAEGQGKKAAREYVLADMSKVVGADGKINPAAMRTWIAQREGVFQAMPELRAEANTMLQDVVNKRGATTALQRDLETATRSQKRTEDEINKAAASLLINTAPDKAVVRVLGADDPPAAMREIVAKVSKDEQAAAGWKRAVVDYLIDKVTTTATARTGGEAEGPVSIAALQRTFKQHEKVLAEAFSPPEMNALRRAHKILEPLGNLSRQATTGSPTAENKLLWNSIEAGLLGVTGNAITTGMIMKRVRVATNFLPDEMAAVKHLISRAMFDPELAQHLLTRDVKRIESAPWNKRLRQLIAGSEVVAESAEEK